MFCSLFCVQLIEKLDVVAACEDHDFFVESVSINDIAKVRTAFERLGDKVLSMQPQIDEIVGAEEQDLDRI